MRTMRRSPHLLIALGLVALVASLASLQYRWLGRVSSAERTDMRERLEQRAREFADDLQQDVVALQEALVRGGMTTAGTGAVLLAELARWQQHARHPAMVANIYSTRLSGDHYAIARLNRETAELEPIEWPLELVPVQEALRLRPADANVPGRAVARVLRWEGGPFVGDADSIVFWLPQRMVESSADDDLRGAVVKTREAQPWERASDQGPVILQLDRAVVATVVLPLLIDRHFTNDRVHVQISDGRGNTLASRGNANGAIEPERADVDLALFVPRPGQVDRLFTWALDSPPAVAPKPGDTRVAIRIEQREVNAAGADAGNTRVWHLRVQHVAGSLDAAVAQARRRNLYLSFGILSVLMAAIGLVIVSARRAEQLASQQMEFVATVSHELRTPLAVIRSAAENISAGIVRDPEQTRSYGELIESEGRRLTDLVEQLLAHAGITASPRIVVNQPIDAAPTLTAVVDGARPAAAAAGCVIELDVEPSMPMVLIDEVSLRSAIENLVANALKHAADGGWIGIRARFSRDGPSPAVAITVSDRGSGIDTADGARIFDPFYRGRTAVERQVPGSGLGLSLVKQRIEQLSGSISFRSRPGEGTVFEVRLPVFAPSGTSGKAPGKAPVARESA